MEVSGTVYNIPSGGGGIDYSTTEQNTGRKWIDGSDIYERTYVIPISAISGNTTIYLATGTTTSGDSNIKAVLNIKGFCRYTQNSGTSYSIIPFGCTWSDTNRYVVNITTWEDGTSGTLFTTWNFGSSAGTFSGNHYFTLEYVKAS